jgi:hypothetical protein
MFLDRFLNIFRFDTENPNRKRKYIYSIVCLILILMVTLIFYKYIFPLCGKKKDLNLNIDKISIDKILDKNNALLSVNDFNSNCII